MPPFITSRQRDAWGSIRGYVYQVDLTIERWLTLPPGSALELERGEDIDTIQNAIRDPGDEETRLLEQIKVRDSLTLRSPEAAEALASFYEHYQANPTVDLSFRYVTTAEVGSEQNSPDPKRVPLIRVWNELRLEVFESANLEALKIIRSFLATLNKPPKLAKETWTLFITFINTASDGDTFAFIKKVEWITNNPPLEDIPKRIQQTLVKQYDVDTERAETVYSSLFVYVFKILSQSHTKLLTAEDLAAVIGTEQLSQDDQKIISNVNFYLSRLDDRVSAIEETLTGLQIRPLPTDEEAQFLLRAYLEEVANQPPYVFWKDETYVDRLVTESRATPMAVVRSYLTKSQLSTKARGLEEIVNLERKLVLLGEPGLGKTTTLLHLAWKSSSYPVPLEETAEAFPIPIHIELKYYEGESDLSILFSRKMNEILSARHLVLGNDSEASTRIIRNWLIDTRLRFFFLLDGINEVREEHHLKLIGLILALLRSPHRAIVSCREQDYDESLRNLAPAFVLQELQPDDILNYLKARLGPQGNAFFFDEILPDKKLLTLAANPLMLSLIATVADPKYKKKSQIGLPRSQGQLLRTFVELMPGLRRADGFVPVVSPDIVTDALSRLALAMQDRQRLTIKIGQCRQLLESTIGFEAIDQILTQAKDWRFLKTDGRMGEPIEFLHQLFLEYFAAVRIVNELQLGSEFEKVLKGRQFDERWFEVLEMVMGIVEQPDAFLKWLCEQAIQKERPEAALLAYRSLVPSGCSDDPTISKVIVGALAATLEHSMGETRENIAWALGQMGDPNAADSLLGELATVSSQELYLLRKYAEDDADLANVARLDSLYERTGMIIVYALGRIGNKSAIQELINLMLDWEEYSLVREQAALSLASLDAEEAIDPLLKVLADSDSDYGLRNSAATALGILRARRAVGPLLKMLKQGDNDTMHSFIRALGKIGDLRARPFLLELRGAERDNEVESDESLIEELDEALQSISIRVDSDPVIALNYPDAMIRREAALLLAKEGDFGALPKLRNLLVDTEETLFGSVADAAKEAINQIEKRELRQLQKDDGDEDV